MCSKKSENEYDKTVAAQEINADAFAMKLLKYRYKDALKNGTNEWLGPNAFGAAEFYFVAKMMVDAWVDHSPINLKDKNYEYLASTIFNCLEENSCDRVLLDGTAKKLNLTKYPSSNLRRLIVHNYSEKILGKSTNGVMPVADLLNRNMEILWNIALQDK